MPDIFLSYNREDQATARRFAEAFQAEGLDVWWDTTLRAGEAYDEVTEAALKTAKAVVVLWSPRSVVSRWVRAEATLADRNKTLVPVTIEPCDRPIMFELTQTADLSTWDGSRADKAWVAFLADVKRLMKAAASPPKAEPGSQMVSSAQFPAAADRLSICVLPFSNMSGDPEQEYFSDGITEDVITDLSKVSALLVIARNTAFTFKARSVDVKQVAHQLDVTHVLEGSVRKAGNRVRITAQLIEGRTDGHLWAERWDRDLDDIFALQDEISEAIVSALKLKLLPEEKKAIEDRGTTNIEAYDLLLRARAHANASRFDRAIELSRAALALDPNFVQAWDGLRFALLLTLNTAPERRQEILGQMDDAAEHMIALAPDSLAGRLIAPLGQYLTRGKFLAAEQLLDRVQGESGASAVFPLRHYLDDASGRFSDAPEQQRRVVRQDPLSLIMSLVLQQILDIVGRPDEAWAEYERSKDLAGDRRIVEFDAFMRMWDRAGSEEVLAQFRRLTASVSEPGVQQLYAQLEPVLFDRDAARDVLRRAGDGVQNLYELTLLAGLYGDTELALRVVRKAFVDQKLITTRAIWHPALGQARRDPRFKDVLRDMGLADYWRASGKWGDFVRRLGDDDFEVIG
jgi:TolB-like protein